MIDRAEGRKWEMDEIAVLMIVILGWLFGPAGFVISILIDSGLFPSKPYEGLYVIVSMLLIGYTLIWTMMLRHARKKEEDRDGTSLDRRSR